MPSPRTDRQTAPPVQPAGRFRVPGIDGLRALAVIGVLVYHLSPGALDGGFIGVDVFFVISGFLITSLLLREREESGRIRLGVFWLRRVRRLVPAVVLLVLVCGAVATALGGDLILRLGSQLLGALTFSSNWLFIAQGSDYFGGAAPELFRNLWSLAVEEQFYLIWPFAVLLLALLPRALRVVVAAALAVVSALAMAALWVPGEATRVYYGTDTHSFGLALGAVVALLADGRLLAAAGRAGRVLVSLLGLAGIGGLVAVAVLLPEDSALPFRGGLALVAVLTALVIAVLLVPGTPLAAVLEWAPIRWVGARSYGLYLWHWPVLLLVSAALPAWRHDGMEGWALGGIAFAITVTAAALSYAFVEQPIRRDGFRRSARLALGWWRYGLGSALAASIAVLLVAVAAGTTGVGVAADPGRSTTQQQVEAGERAIAAPKPSPSAAAASATGDQIVVVGDSVTLAASPELSRQFPGIAIDAVVSRQMNAAPALLTALQQSGRLRPVVVLALGTNGGFPRSVLDRVRSIIGPERELVLVNTQEPRGWEDSVNQTLADFAQTYRNVELANWHDAIQPNLDQLNRDQIHFGGFGARVWTGAVKDALQRLAELPPERGAHDWAGVPRPG